MRMFQSHLDPGPSVTEVKDAHTLSMVDVSNCEQSRTV
jgi:hypothetical protein